MNIVELTDTVLSLSVEERIKIADSVYRSLNSFQEENETLWAQVAVQRTHDIDSVTSIPVSGPDALLDLKKLYRP
jgi:hypothetical protein